MTVGMRLLNGCLECCFVLVNENRDPTKRRKEERPAMKEIGANRDEANAKVRSYHKH